MFVKPTETDFIQAINENIDYVKSIPIDNAVKCAGAIRSTLEYAVKLFWLKKYDGYAVPFNLSTAISDKSFSHYFRDMETDYMRIIRRMCNKVIHEGYILTLDEAKDLLDMLQKCIKAIEKAIPMKIITSPMLNMDHAAVENKTSQVSVKTGDEVVLAPKTRSCDIQAEQTVFWNMLQEALDNNGNPFSIQTRRQYGTVNQHSANSPYCLGFDFLLTKRFFRISIYVQDDTQKQCYDRLLQHKGEIESMLGFSPIWNAHGVRNENTRRIETRLAFIPYDRADYERLIDEALPVFMKYIAVCKNYLPDIFEI